MNYAAIADWVDTASFPVNLMCAQLGVSRSAYYAWRSRDPSAHQAQDVMLTRLIQQFFERLRGNPGVRRMHAELAAAGHRVARKRVWRLMRAAGLQGRHPRAWKKTTTAGQHPVPAPDLIARSFTAAQPNQKWCGDITYIKTWDGWAYVATVIDLHSRALIGWAAADHMQTTLITDALDMAITHCRPPTGVIFHSDRGTQGTSVRLTEHLALAEIRPSIGTVGDAYDNALMETINGLYKAEAIRTTIFHRGPYKTIADVEYATAAWVEWYNNRRLHSTLGNVPPVEYEQRHYAALNRVPQPA